MNQNPNRPAGKQLNPAEVQELLGEMLLELDDAGQEIVQKRVEEQGLDPAGVSWLLSQACLSIAVSSHFHANRPLEEILGQIRAAWAQHQEIAASSMPQGMIPQGRA